MKNTFNLFNHVGSKSNKFTIAMISKSKVATSPWLESSKKSNVEGETFASKSSKNKRVQKMHKHIRICFRIQLGRITRRFCRKFMYIINILHITFTSIIGPQKIITKISGDY
jgi:hypothetical protein